MIFTTKVRRGPANELVLRACGPGLYQASLVDDSMVAWKDAIRFKVTSVDHVARRKTAELIERVEGPRWRRGPIRAEVRSRLVSSFAVVMLRRLNPT